MLKNEVFIIGAKGIPARYGGFESFVDQLTARKNNNHIHYYVACRRDLSDNKANTYEYNGSTCFNVDVPNIGPVKAILYDVKAFQIALKIIKKNNIQHPIIYVLACRIGPFVGHLKKQLKAFEGELFVNPDGHEWMRAKWSAPVREYWRVSERLMVKHADLLICDSKNIEKYIQNDYVKYSPKTTYISYGAVIKKSEYAKTTPKVLSWYGSNSVKLGEYYLIVGRFVPENNYETMIKEFMKSGTSKDLVIITNVEKNSFYKKLMSKTNFMGDKRVKFVGTVYDTELLRFIRENAFAYIHGHEVGGTNPSLLEALGSTKVNLLLNVGFNREVGMAGARYWNKQEGDLSSLITKAESFSNREIDVLNKKSNQRISNQFDWPMIIDNYEQVFIKGGTVGGR